MRQSSRSHQWSLASSLLLVLLAGCATSRGVVVTPIVQSANPESGAAVKLVRVTDARKFELAPRTPSIPSLKGGEINDPAVSSRAIARKRNSYGKALGDILLPEGDTVSELVAATLKKGLREGGFRVLDEGDSGFDTAVPLEADIEKFWMWFSPGFWAIHMEFDGLVRLKGGIAPFDDSEEFKASARVGAQAATENQWMKTLQLGLDDLHRNIVSRLDESPAEAVKSETPAP